MGKSEHADGPLAALLPTCLNGVRLTFSPVGQVDQLEDRYLGMVEASGSNPDLSISLLYLLSAFICFHSKAIVLTAIVH